MTPACYRCPRCDRFHEIRPQTLLTITRCKECGLKVEFEKRQLPKPNFDWAKHLAYTFLSCGLWLYVLPFAYLQHRLAPPPTDWFPMPFRKKERRS